MKDATILLVEDEDHIARGLVFNLKQEGYQVIHVASGQAALEALWGQPTSLVVLDLMLPDMHGLEICRRIRKIDQRLPILMLTALGKDEERVAGLKAGADDYLTKPFNLAEFLLRVNGMLRRSRWYRPDFSYEQRYTFGSNVVDLQRRTALTDQGEIDLTELECRMLRTFFQHEGEILSRSELLQSVWGMAPGTETRTLDNFIVRLRRYFEPNPAKPTYFHTIRGRGYRFVQDGREK